MTVRYHREIDGSQVDVESPYVGGKDLRVIARVEKNPVPPIFDESCKAPIVCEASAVTKGAVKNCDAVGRWWPSRISPTSEQTDDEKTNPTVRSPIGVAPCQHQ